MPKTLETSSQEVTRLLIAWSEGDQAALEKLIPLVYQELRRLAKRYLRQERPATACNRRRSYTRRICD